MIEPWSIESVDPRNLSDAQYAAYNEFGNILRRERLPDDPPVPLEETIQGNRNIPAFVHLDAWAVTDITSGRLIAAGSADIVRLDHNRHVAEFQIEVLPEHRRRGIGRALLARAVDFARTEDRTLLLASTSSAIPAGEEFMRRIGAQVGLSSYSNQLLMSDVDQALIDRWIAEGKQASHEFEFGLWEGDYPEGELSAIADLFNVMNQQPRDNLQVEDWQTTPDVLRQLEKSWGARNGVHWTMYVRHKPSGQLAGFTDVVWYPSRPETLNQGNTGIWPQFRGKGLGRWLKAAMLEKVIRELPQVTRVRTGNAMSNAPMLKINTELGFKPFQSSHVWQVQREQVERYLQAGIEKKAMAQ